MMDIVSKDFPVVAGEPTTDYPHGTFEVILSSPTLDRDGEIVDSKAFEPLPGHITFDTDHSLTCDSVVGSGSPSYAEDGTLRVKGGFASDDRSQTIRQKVLDGHIRSTSVTFMAAERVKDEKGVPHVVKAELLNGTFTPVPSNRESVVLTAKSIVDHELAQKVGARNSSADASVIQSMHDSAVTLGAACAAKSVKALDPAAGEDETADPVATAQAADAALDEALNLLADVDLAALPTEVQQAVALLQAADLAMDELLDALGITDADEDAATDAAPGDTLAPKSAPQDPDTKSADDAADPAAEAAGSTATSTDAGSDRLARWDETRKSAEAVFGI